MTRFIVAAATTAALAFPLAAQAQDVVDCSEMSPENCARLKAAAGSEEMNNQIYINGRLLDVESGMATTGPDGQIYIRMSPDYDLTPSVDDDPVAGTLTQAEIQSICNSGDDEAQRRIGIECF